MLPEPSSIFTIPSLHDSNNLECRIYHPRTHSRGPNSRGSSSNGNSSPSIAKAVTIAHPYTPMGGCFDDHVLQAAGAEFLKHGYILGLFNLRGGGKSEGHTSWTSRPEQDDYLSFVGFLLCYMEKLHIGLHGHDTAVSSPMRDVPLSTPTIPASEQDINASKASSQERILVLGGYSYGSLLARQIPDLSTILSHFSSPEVGSAAAEIRLRAQHLASEYIHKLSLIKPRGRTLTVECPASPLGSPVYGGEESQPGTRRVSRESKRSLDVVRKAVDRSRGRIAKCENGLALQEGSARQVMDARTMARPEIRYLLISPLLPPLSAFLSLSLSIRGWKSDGLAEQRLREHRTLAVWGSHDFFTSSKRLEKWAKTLQTGDSRFRAHEVQDAGHFWLEEGVEGKLRESIRVWLNEGDG